MGAFFEAAFGGSGILLMNGVDGTGKTETSKDICLMLGMSATVVNGSEGLSDDAAVWTHIAEQADAIIIDEASRLSGAAIEAAVRCARGANIPLCLTGNPNDAGNRID